MANTNETLGNAWQEILTGVDGLRDRIHQRAEVGDQDALAAARAMVEAFAAPTHPAGPEMPAPIDVASALLHKPAPLDHVLPGLLAGDVGLLVAPGGSGKGFLALEIAVSVALGLPLAGGAWPAPEKTGRVVYLAGEDTPAVLSHRLYALGQWLSESGPMLLEHFAKQFALHSLVGTIPEIVSEEGQRGPWWQTIRQVAEGARLLILDPLARMHSGEENASAIMTRLVQHIEAIAQETGSSILVLHHTNKVSALSGTGEVQQAARGSSALTDAVRWQGNLSGMPQAVAKEIGLPEDRRRFWLRLSLSKSNYVAPLADTWLRRGEGGILTVGDPASEATGEPKGSGKGKATKSAKASTISSPIDDSEHHF